MWALLAIATIAIGLGIATQQWQGTEPSADLKQAILLPTPKALPETSFTSHLGNAFSTQDFIGRWHVLFFGFTHCPDICPTTLYTLGQVQQALLESGHAEQLQVAMVTVDPARDTPERLAQYVPYFNDGFLGLTTDPKSLAEFSRSVGVLYIARDQDERGNYDVDHSAALILINPDGQYAGAIPAPHTLDDLAHDLAEIIGNAKPEKATAASKLSNQLQISEPWIRAAPLGADALAGYFTVHNSGSSAINIVAATSPMFDEIEIHATRIADGIASMSLLPELSIPANSDLQLKPLGTHLMLIDPESTIELGQLIPITLELSDGSSKQAIFTVRKLGIDE